MRSKNKVRYFVISFLILSVLAGNIFLTQRVESHILLQRENIRSVTDTQREERYKIYKDISEVKSVLTGYTVYSFSTTLFVVFCLLVCEQRNRKIDDTEWLKRIYNSMGSY